MTHITQVWLGGSLIPWGLCDFHFNAPIYKDRTCVNFFHWRPITALGVIIDIGGSKSNLFVPHTELQTSVPEQLPSPSSQISLKFSVSYFIRNWYSNVWRFVKLDVCDFKRLLMTQFSTFRDQFW